MRNDRGAFVVLLLIVIGAAVSFPSVREAAVDRPPAAHAVSLSNGVTVRAGGKVSDPNVSSTFVEPETPDTATIADPGADTPTVREEVSAIDRADGSTYFEARVQPLENEPTRADLVSLDDKKLLARLAAVECNVMGDQREACAKSVVSTVLSRIALDRKMDGHFSLSDGTVWGTITYYENGIPQFVPEVWEPDCQEAERIATPETCRLSWLDISEYYGWVDQALNGDGGPCPGFLYYDSIIGGNSDCKIVSGSHFVEFHQGWGWHELLDRGEWRNGLPVEGEKKP